MKVPRLPDWAKALLFLVGGVAGAALALAAIIMGFLTYQCSVNHACL